MPPLWRLFISLQFLVYYHHRCKVHTPPNWSSGMCKQQRSWGQTITTTSQKIIISASGWRPRSPIKRLNCTKTACMHASCIIWNRNPVLPESISVTWWNWVDRKNLCKPGPWSENSLLAEWQNRHRGWGPSLRANWRRGDSSYRWKSI